MTGLRTTLGLTSVSILLILASLKLRNDSTSDHEENDYSGEVTKPQENSNPCSRVTTRISNPGIVDRLEKDISSFKAYGFSFERESDVSGLLKSQGNYKSISIATSLHIQVKDVTLVASTGPFLRTLVRLCVDPINPRSLQAVIVIGSGSKKNDGRSLAHSIHMLLRNSMGAALFLNLHVVLPTESNRESVLEWMRLNDEGCYEYPSVTIHDLSESITGFEKRIPFEINLGLIQEFKNAPPTAKKPLTQTCLSQYDSEAHYIALNVTTRMCTVRLTPVIYLLSQKLLIGSISTASLASETGSNHDSLLLICLEKISNLYRVLMLCRDYGGVEFIGRQLVVVCKEPSAVKRFDREAQTFVSRNFIKNGASNDHYLPRVLSIEDTRELLRRKIAPSPSPNVIGFDLHEDAETLREDSGEAKAILHSAGAIILGYESDGIPEKINEIISHHVQIQSRTSVNIVAAFSIVLHVIFNH
jgi:hypothetical protein